MRPSDCMLIWREAELYPHWFPFVSGGKMLGELHPSEAVLQLFVDTSFMNVDIPLWGWACDNTSVDKSLLFCVRPVDSDTQLPLGVARPDPTSGRSIKLLGSWRALAHIDILVEPTGPRSVRIAFRMMGELPSYAPSWTFNHIVQDGMCNIFREMSRVAWWNWLLSGGTGGSLVCGGNVRMHQDVTRPDDVITPRPDVFDTKPGTLIYEAVRRGMLCLALASLYLQR